jgi:UDP-N-acetylglucosamine/UDP-N-acetylgalactosamine diphosphorylase
MTMSVSADSIREQFTQAGQGHVFAHWESLDEAARASLLAQAGEIDLAEVQHLVDTLVKGDHAAAVSLEGLEPAPYAAHPASGGDQSLWEEMRVQGETALKAGRVAAFTVAGGQGTRLGYDGPKGCYPVGPVTKKPLFQVFAEKIRAAEIRYEVTIPWFIMTSDLNHAATEAAFKEADFWGLQASQVQFFKQGRMPAVDPEGKIILSGKSEIAMSPDGHGGSLRALVRSGAIERMKSEGIDVISYFQVDNPLIQIIDPAFVGFHLVGGSEMSSKMIPKAYPLEKLGHFCTQNGNTVVVEYSDLPEEMQEERDSEGELRYRAGSIAIHLLSVDFVTRAGGNDTTYALPFHRAHKKIPVVQADGTVVKPEEPNGYKFEMFVFDALPFADKPVIIETLRSDEFSPVKNAEGKDSPATCRADQLKLWAGWLAGVGVEVPTDDEGVPTVTFEVSPLFADSAANFATKWSTLESSPKIDDGVVLE